MDSPIKERIHRKPNPMPRVDIITPLIFKKHSTIYSVV